MRWGLLKASAGSFWQGDSAGEKAGIVIKSRSLITLFCKNTYYLTDNLLNFLIF